MPQATASGGVRLHLEEAGRGSSSSSFTSSVATAGAWSLEPQMNHFAHRHRCMAFVARGFPPPDVPASIEAYSQEIAADDIVAVMDAAGIGQAHLVGLTMGGFAILHAGLRHPDRVLSITAAGAGYGAEKAHEAYFEGISEQVATNFQTQGAPAFAKIYPEGASRMQFQDKDPCGWRLLADRLGQHDSRGTANIMRGVQMRRPSLYDLKDALQAMMVPLLVVVGDEDGHCLQPGIFLKKTVPASGLAAFEAVAAIRATGRTPRHAIEVVAWTNEEACRFAPGMTGSDLSQE